ncbi:MAG: Beta-lactamase precursor [Pseudomonadota bacterium]|jgi:glyoxylase-like metal-dependent hydrolase (beta-lactamase superfamily II)
MFRNALLSLTLTLFTTAWNVAAGAQADRVPFFRIYDVSPRVHMLESPDAGGNIGVLDSPAGVLLVDARYEQDTPALLTAVSTISDAPIRYLINTHVHPDHIGGNANLAALGVTIYAHDNVRQRMLSELRIPRRGGIFFAQPPAQALPVVTFGESIGFHLGDEEIRVFLAPPAHTDGDSFVQFVQADVLHLGDVFRTNMYPIIDKYNGGSFLGMIDAMNLAIDLAGPDTRVIPGHGYGVSDRAGMIEVRDLLLDMKARVQALVAQGMSLEQVLAAAPLAPHDERWGQVPSWTASDLVPIIYEELRAVD